MMAIGTDGTSTTLYKLLPFPSAETVNGVTVTLFYLLGKSVEI